jgi:hypothetical protein
MAREIYLLIIIFFCRRSGQGPPLGSQASGPDKTNLFRTAQMPRMYRYSNWDVLRFMSCYFFAGHVRYSTARLFPLL